MALKAAAAPLAILAAGPLLVWPAFLNGYPILFSDTGAFLAQTVQPLMIWDKPWVYGPMLAAFHWGATLWGPLLAQGLLLSGLLWLVQRVVRGHATAAAHLLLSALLAALTALPWVAALLMPDVLTPVVALALFLLGFGGAVLSRAQMLALGLLAALGIAAHLSHLPLAAALLLATALLARALWPVARVAAPLALALALLLGSNLVGHGRLSLSPFGATFLLARLIGDGPAARTIAARCPASGWHLCAWAGRLPADSDEFLWLRDSPVNEDAAGQPIFLGGARLAPEARAIVAETLRREPWAVAGAMLGNFGRQLLLARVGDTLGRDHLGTAACPRLEQGFSAAEVARYDASAQSRGLLATRAAPWLWPQIPVLLLGAVALAAQAWRLRAWPEGGARQAFALFLFVAVAANAFATGALSKPHHRYQARIAWLLPFGAALLALPHSQPALRKRANSTPQTTAMTPSTTG